MWALKKLNMDWGDAYDQCLSQLNKIDEFEVKTYESLVL